MSLSKDTSYPKENITCRILLIDDDEDDNFLTCQMLAEARQGKFTLEWASSYETGEKRLAEDPPFDAVIVDYSLGSGSGIDLIRQAVARQYPAPILLLTGRGAYEVDLQAMEAGAADYLSKDELNPAFLERAIRYAIERKKQEISLRKSAAQIRQSEADLRKTNEALRKSEERYRALFSSMLNGFALCEIICDADGVPVDYRFLEVNPAFEQLTGLKTRDVIGKTVREVLPGIEPTWIETYGKVALTGEPVQFENYVAPLEKYYQVYAFSPQKNQFAALFIDVTRRKQMEDELLDSQRDLANAQAVALTGSWRLDVRKDKLVWSDETYRLFEVPIGTPLTYESFVGKIHPDDREAVDRAWQAALTGATAAAPYDIEHRIVAGERVKWVRERAILEFDPQGALKGGFGIVQDITERKQAEAALKANAEALLALEQASIQYRAEMEIHHRLMEFREKERQEIARDLHDGPVQELSSAIFGIQILRENTQDPAVQLELEQIRSCIKSVVTDLRGMMNELRPPSLIRFGLGKAIENHVEDLLDRNPTLQVDLDLDPNEAEARLPETVSLTLFRIYQEAITNAIRHANATRISVRFFVREDRARLEIQDNGCGFIVPKDWNAEAQIGHYGLPGMRERADTVGGEFMVTSTPGSGTTIQVEVPLDAHREEKG